MNIVYVANEDYRVCLGVSLYSLLCHHRGEKELGLFVISTGLGRRTGRKLKETAKDFGRSLEIIDFSHIEKRFSVAPDTSRFNIAALGRFFLGELLPPSVDKVLYLDCDTLVLGNLTGLEKRPLGGALLSAAMEPTIYRGLREEIGLYGNAPYFNSGVLWIDLKAWRQESIGEKLLAYLASIQSRSLFPDQDAINGLLTGRILPMEPRYNFFTNYRYFSYEALCGRDRNFRRIKKADFASAKKEPALLHFAGEDRPWFRGCLNPYRKRYAFYREKTRWREERPIPGREIRLWLYHGMNVITPFFPGLREWIGERFYKNLKRRRDGKPRKHRRRGAQLQ